MIALIDTETNAEPNQKDDGADTPDNPEHGKKAAKLGVPERGYGLFKISKIGMIAWQPYILGL